MTKSPVGFYDPDDELKTSSRPKWAIPNPNTAIGRVALKIFKGRRKYWQQEENQLRKKLQQYCDVLIAGDLNSFSHEMWIDNCVKVGHENSYSTAGIVKWILNVDKRNEWLLINREKISTAFAEKKVKPMLQETTLEE